MIVIKAKQIFNKTISVTLKFFMQKFLLKNIFLFFLISLYFTTAQAQKNITCVFIPSDTSKHVSNLISNEIKSPAIFRDTLQFNQQINSLLEKLRSEGYYTAGIDSIKKESQYYTVYVFVGDQYSWGRIRQGNVPEDFLQGTGFRKNGISGKSFSSQKLGQLNSKILRNSENNGYPFASLKLDSIDITNSAFSGALVINKNRFVKIDSIIVKGNATIAPVYIYNYIGIKPGDAYKEIQVKRITSRLKELSFLKETKPSQILFTEKEAKLFLFLENKKASQFDGVIGFLPDESKQGKLNLTGEVHLKLLNSLKRGEIIELNWKQLPVKSQDLKVRAYYPFILNTPFGFEGMLAIFKKDTTYIDVTKNIGIQYALTGNNFIKVFINDKQSDLQTAKGLENITTLPEFADISITSYGSTFHYEKLDYRLNPRKGFSVEATGSTGNRRIRKNSEINKVVYENIRLKTVTYQGELTADGYYSPAGRHVLNPGLQAVYIYNPELFVNELFRIGGLKSLRGFDEESIYASAAIIGKLEYRYLLEQNSFLFTFFNLAWYENKSRNKNIHDTPMGFGTGINFETKIGIMSVSYALGKQFGNPIYFRNGKIHFGIVNYF